MNLMLVLMLGAAAAVSLSCMAASRWVRARTGLPLDRSAYDAFTSSFEADIAVISMDLKKFHYASPGLRSVFRLSPVDMTVASFLALVHPDDHDGLVATLRSGKSGPFETEFRILKNEQASWMRAKGYPVPGIRGTRLALWVLDISDRKRDELTIVQARDYEVSVGARIQQTLLLGRPEREYRFFRIACLSLPSQSIDGDFTDFYDNGNEDLDFMIGDVMGKGIAAALTGAAARNAFMQARAKQYQEKPCAISTLQSIVSSAEASIGWRMTDIGTFATLVYGRLDGKAGLFRYVDCGHTSVIHFERRSGQCWRLKGSNMPMGFLPKQEYQEYVVPIEPGDKLFLFSDGISEAANSDGEFFGETRLMKLVRASAKLDADALLEKVKQITFSYAAGNFKDDVTGISIQVLSTGKLPKLSSRRFPQSASSLRDIRDFFETCLAESFPDEAREELKSSFLIAIGEAASNVFRHNAPEGQKNCTAVFRRSDGWLAFYLYYRGKDYAWQDPPTPAVERFQTGGYGLYLMNEAMDSVTVSAGDEGWYRLCMLYELPAEGTAPDAPDEGAKIREDAAAREFIGGLNRRLADLFSRQEVEAFLAQAQLRVDGELIPSDRGIDPQALLDAYWDGLSRAKGSIWMSAIQGQLSDWIQGRNLRVPDTLKQLKQGADDAQDKLIRDNTRLREENLELQKSIIQASDDQLKDPVTGFYTELFFEKYLESLGSSGESGSRVADSVAFIRLDNIQSLNQRHGAKSGDLALKGLAYFLLNNKRHNTVFFRMNGPLFACHLQGEGKQKAIDYARELKTLVEESKQFIERVTISAAIVDLLELEPNLLEPKLIYGSIMKVGKERLKLLDKLGPSAICAESTITLRRSSGSVMLIEGNIFEAELLKNLLEREGFEVHAVMNGSAAIAQADLYRPDVIVSEIFIPQMDGFQIRQRFNSSPDLKAVPFILISRDKSEATVKRAFDLGIRHFFRKPVLGAELAGTIAMLIREPSSERLP